MFKGRKKRIKTDLGTTYFIALFIHTEKKFNISGMTYNNGGHFEARKQITQANHTYTTK